MGICVQVALLPKTSTSTCAHAKVALHENASHFFVHTAVEPVNVEVDAEDYLESSDEL